MLFYSEHREIVEENSKLNTGVGVLCLKLGFSLIHALLDDSSQAMEDILWQGKRGAHLAWVWHVWPLPPPLRRRTAL